MNNTIDTQLRKLNHHGYSYYYRIIENAKPQFEPTLFISGAFQTMDSWNKFVRSFAEQSTVIVADLPGSGRADSVPAATGFHFFADAIAGILRDTGIQRCYVISASYGTPIAFTFARYYPTYVSRMVLAGTMKAIPSHLRSHISRSVELAEQNRMEEFADYVIHNGLLCHSSDKHIEKRALALRVITSELKNMKQDAVRKYILNTRRLLNHRPLDLNSAPDIPVLVFTGEHDVFTLPHYCREIAAAFPDATFTTVQHSDHLFHIEQFDVSLDLLLRFGKNQTLNEVKGCNEIEHFHNHGLPRRLPSHDGRLQQMTF